MSLDCGRKPKYPETTHADAGRTSPSCCPNSGGKKTKKKTKPKPYMLAEEEMLVFDNQP